MLKSLNNLEEFERKNEFYNYYNLYYRMQN